MTRYNRINSKIEDITRLEVYPIPSKPLENARVAKVGGTVVLVSSTGRIYSSAADGHIYWASTRRLENTVAALQKLGLVSAAAWKQHKDAEQAEHDASSKRYAAKEALRVHKELGLKLTPSTVKSLRTLLTERDLLELDSAQRA